MKFNQTWGYGQLFGFSAMDGTTHFHNDFIATLTAEPIGFRFELASPIKIVFPLTGSFRPRAVMGDFVDIETDDGDFFITFADADTLVGYSPVKPVLSGGEDLRHYPDGDVEIWRTPFDILGVLVKEENGLYRFSVHHGEFQAGTRFGTAYFIGADIEKLRAERYGFYDKIPPCRKPEYEALYYKAVSILKVNTFRPEGKITTRWTTPDRVPHRRMWLWDSVFAALALGTFDIGYARDAIRAVLSQVRADGFAPHMMSPVDASEITQPPLLAWGVWSLYKKYGGKDYLAETVDPLKAYLSWDMENRDKNRNGLYEWYVNKAEARCRCGESGLDNSPRFDSDDDMDHVDFNFYLVNDTKCLSFICRELGDTAGYRQWKNISDGIRNRMNAHMWNEAEGAYFDCRFDGSLSEVLSPAGYMPLFAEIPDAEQARRMAKTLQNEKKLWTPMPLASVSRSDPAYSNDMFRGGVWIPLDYFVAKGLRNYGFDELSDRLIGQILEKIEKFFELTGSIFEFYDPEDSMIPYFCDRKGKCTNPPDFRRHTHSIMDYNWSAAFTLLFIQGELY